MKAFVLLTTISILTLLTSCKEKIDRPDSVLTPEQLERINSQPVASPVAASGGVQHYICPNGHAQGGDAAGTCSECGAEFTHNQAFHSQPAAGTTPNPASSSPPPGVQHYICPNGHDQGGPSAGTCSECGAEFTHNQAYHNSDPVAQGAPTNVTVPPASQSVEPPQNASGVWHYICPNGHAGGGAGATPCGECGTTMIHNTAYHN